MIMTWNINLFFLIDVFLSAARWLFYVLYLLFTMFFILYAFIFKGCIIRRRRKFWWFHAVVLQKTAKKSTRLKTHVLKYCPAHEISFFFLPRPRCRRDLRESSSYKTSRTPQGGNISFLPLISLSMRCMHNEVCGCTEILLLNVAGKSRSPRKFPAFLSLMQTKVENWEQSSRAIVTQTQITCLRKRTSEHVTFKRIVLHSDVRCVLRCVPEWTQPQTCGTTHGENGLCLKQDGVLVSQLFLASIGKECPAQYLVLTVPMQHCATNGVQTTKTKRLRATKRYVSRFRVIGKMHI